MGPGFSTLTALALMLVAWGLGVPDSPQFLEAAEVYNTTQDMSEFSTEITLAIVALSIATIMGAINLLQLLPVLPLDGGQTLRAVLQSFSAKWARWVLLALTGLGILGLAYVGEYLLAGILVLGALQAWHMRSEAPRARPMSAASATLIGLGYALTLAVHGGAIYFGILVYVFAMP